MSTVHDVDHGDLQVLCAVHRHGAVTRAANQLGSTQSAVSHTLRRLRATFGDPLFVRQGRGMQPTPLCEQLVHQLEPHLNAIQRVLQGPVAFDPATSQRRFQLASIDLFDALLLPALVAALARDAPGTELVVSTHGSDSVQRMDRGQLDAVIHPVLMDAGVDPLPTAGLRRRTLLRDGWALFRRAEREAPVDLDAFCRAPHLLVAPGEGPGPVDHALAALGRSRRTAVRLPGFANALAVLGDSDLLLVAPAALQHLAGPGIAVDPVPLALPDHQVTLVWPERLHDEPAHRWFRDLLAELVHALPLARR